MLKAVIVEVDHSSMTSLGVQLASDPSAFGTLGENALNALTTLANNATTGTMTFDSSLNLNVLVDLLAKTVNAKILNQPTLWTKDNEEANFFKGSEVALIKDGEVASLFGQFDIPGRRRRPLGPVRRQPVFAKYSHRNHSQQSD